MIHMGSDHRCIMATFLINTPGKNTHARRENKKHETIEDVEHEQKEKTHQEIVDTIKKPPPKKEMKFMTQQITRKIKSKKRTLQQQKLKALIQKPKHKRSQQHEAQQEIERRSTKRSSTVANQRGVPGQHEHRRQDGWTSAPRGSDDEKKGSERDMTAGERLQNQRPHPLVKIEDEEGAHEADTGSGCSGGCDMLAGARLPKQRPHGEDHPEHNPEEHLVAQVPHQDQEAASIKEVRVTTSAAAKESE